MDRNECETVIPAARNTTGLSQEDLLKQLNTAAAQFRQNTQEKFHTEGEFWTFPFLLWQN